jgi:hypothetical protein
MRKVDVMQPNATELDSAQIMTLEAFADTMIPGERRSAEDLAVAGVADGGGAVASGAVELMASPEGGIGGMLDDLVVGLNDHAKTYADEHGCRLDDGVPPFVALTFADRTALAAALMAPDSPEREMWVSLAMFSFMAWDTGASMHTADAITAGHPGLLTMGFAAPDADGLYRFPDFSYRRELATTHPNTTPSGDPR